MFLRAGASRCDALRTWKPCRFFLNEEMLFLGRGACDAKGIIAA